jgi:hypothetical protein
MKAKTFEEQFDAGVDITGSLDLSKAKRVLLTPRQKQIASILTDRFPTAARDSKSTEVPNPCILS